MIKKVFILIMTLCVFFMDPRVGLGAYSFVADANNSLDQIIQNKTQNCVTTIEGGIVKMSYACFVNDTMPAMSLQAITNILWPHIIDIKGGYDTSQKSFTSNGTQLVFDGSVRPRDQFKSEVLSLGSLSKKMVLLSDASFDVPLETIASKILSQYHIASADRDVSKYSDCKHQNFAVGMRALSGGIVLEPNQLWNANQTFRDLPGYCRGDETFMFYQGICGVSTMAYRASILEPNTTITKRHGHGNRFTTYYGETVVGDDAAIYEMTKQFEFQNTSSKDMIIRSKRLLDKPYLVIISEQPVHKPITISKIPLDTMSARVERSHDGKITSRTSVYGIKIRD